MKFRFVLNQKLIIFGCPKIWAHYSLIIMCSNIGTSKTINFPFGTNGKLMVLGVPILKLFRVSVLQYASVSDTMQWSWYLYTFVSCWAGFKGRHLTFMTFR